MRSPDWESPDGAVKLFLGDCRALLTELPAGSCDAVVTDPPYNIGCKYGDYDDSRPDDEYENWCREWFVDCQRVSKRQIVFPGHGNLGMWHRILRPRGIGCWY